MRNKFEKALAKELSTHFKYEKTKLSYILERTYTPDWTDTKNKIMIESKGYWRASDRQKMLVIQKQYPDWLIILVFQNPNSKINKKSKTTYKQWAIKHRFEVLTIEDLKEFKGRKDE